MNALRGPKTLARRAWHKWRRMSIEHYGRRPFSLRADAPYVSFTFDDFPRTALVDGGRILASHGARGTYFVSCQLLDGPSVSGPIASRDELPGLIADGHELGCHTFEHLDGCDSTVDAFERSVANNRRAVADIVPDATLPVFAYPLDGPVLDIKRAVGTRFIGCRGGGQTFNAGSIDLNLLKAYFLDWKNRDDLNAVRRVIADNAAARGWLIFATHDVADRPSPYGCISQVLRRGGPPRLRVWRAGPADDGCLPGRGNRVMTPDATVRTAHGGARDGISVCVCTYRRPQLLRSLLDALAAQETGGGFDVDVVVVDNDPEASAAPVVEDVAARASLPIRYHHEPVRNISLTRNRAVEFASGNLIAFIDDDECPAPDWLHCLHDMLVATGADGVLAPVCTRLSPRGTAVAARRPLPRSSASSQRDRRRGGRRPHRQRAVETRALLPGTDVVRSRLRPDRRRRQRLFYPPRARGTGLRLV